MHVARWILVVWAMVIVLLLIAWFCPGISQG